MFCSGAETNTQCTVDHLVIRKTRKRMNETLLRRNGQGARREFFGPIKRWQSSLRFVAQGEREAGNLIFLHSSNPNLTII